MQRTKRVFKLLLIIILVIPLLFLLTIIILVRFTNLTWTDNGKSIIGYDETKNEWVINDWEEKYLDSPDGPYIFCNENTKDCDVYRVKLVHNEFTVVSVREKRSNLDSITVKIKDSTSFNVKLRKDYDYSPSLFSMPDTLVAMSDIEGNFNAFSNLLIQSGVIDENYNWKLGTGHLVLNGDFVDRGNDVTEVLWLIYKLEQNAEINGGKVHFILGNHEVMNLNSVTRNVNDKYIAFAQQYSKENNYMHAYKKVMSNNNEIVRWLKSKNIIVRIGDYIFTHGGLSYDFISEYKPSIAIINESFHEIINNETNVDQVFKKSIMSRRGPLWFRGNVIDYKEYYEKESAEKFNKSLNHFDANKLFIGHTVVDNISSDYHGKLIKLDVKHGENYGSNLSECIVIKNDTIFVVHGDGEKRVLE